MGYAEQAPKTDSTHLQHPQDFTVSNVHTLVTSLCENTVDKQETATENMM